MILYIGELTLTNGVLRGSSTKVFKISINMPSIVTDIKTPKWEGVTINFF